MMQGEDGVGDAGGAEDKDESHEELHESPLDADLSDELICGECEEHVVQDDQRHSKSQRGFRSQPPSFYIQKLHNITHWPYSNWCPHCVMARLNESPHSQSRKRRGPLTPLVCPRLLYCQESVGR